MGEGDIRLECRTRLLWRAQYLLKHDKIIVKRTGPGTYERSVVQLWRLDHHGRRFRRLPLGWLAGACLLAAAGAYIVLLGFRESAANRAGVFVASGIVLIPALICMGKSLSLMTNSTTFSDLLTGEPLVELPCHKPDPDSFRRFTAALAARIRRCQAGMTKGELAGELLGLEQLREEGTLSNQEYRVARAKLLGLELWQMED